MSLLKTFLVHVDRIDLLEQLEQTEFRIAIGIILEYVLGHEGRIDSYTNTRKPTTTKTDTRFATAKLTTLKGIAYNVYADRIIEFLVNTREQNKELILKAWEQLHLVDDKSIILVVLDSEIQECQQSPQSSWSMLTALLVILGEFYPSISPDSAVNINKLLADQMLKNGGLVSACM